MLDDSIPDRFEPFQGELDIPRLMGCTQVPETPVEYADPRREQEVRELPVARLVALKIAAIVDDHWLIGKGEMKHRARSLHQDVGALLSGQGPYPLHEALP